MTKNDNNNNIFDTALHKKYRFEYKGQISLEDLYDLSMQELDNLYKKYTLKIKEEKIQSLMNNEYKSDNEIKHELIKHVFHYKQDLYIKHNQNIEKQETKARVMEIIKRKQDTELENKSIRELEEMIKDL